MALSSSRHSPTPSDRKGAREKSLDDPAKAKLRQRIKLEIEQQQDLDGIAKVKLVELLHELDHQYVDRVVREKKRRLEVHDNAVNNELQREEKLLTEYEAREKMLEEKKTQLEKQRLERQQQKRDLHNARLTKALETKKKQEEDAFLQLKKRQQERHKKMKEMEERRSQYMEDVRQNRANKDDKRDRILQELLYSKTERDAMLDVKAYEKDIAMELANARRAQARQYRIEELEEQRKKAAVQSQHVVTVMKEKAKDSEIHRDQRLKELAKERTEKYARMAREHAEREQRVADRKNKLFEEKNQKRLEELERLRERQQHIDERIRKEQEDRWENIKGTETHRWRTKQKAENLVDEKLTKAEETEAHRRRGRTERFFNQLGLKLRANEYVLDEDEEERFNLSLPNTTGTSYVTGCGSANNPRPGSKPTRFATLNRSL